MKISNNFLKTEKFFFKNVAKKIEYDNENNILVYEGEYIKGEKNKGKEYDNECGNLIFEGEYLNGKKWNGILRRYEKIEIKNTVNSIVMSEVKNQNFFKISHQDMA